MKKYKDLKDIDSYFNRRIAQLEYQRRHAKEMFEDGLNKKKFEKSDSKEQVRQQCMELIQVNCRMMEAIIYNSDIISCCSCGKKDKRYNLQGGHRISRSVKRTSCMQSNINPQCSSCNYKCMTKNKQTLDSYDQYFIERYGQQEFDKSNKLAEIKAPLQETKQHRETMLSKLKIENATLKETITNKGWNKK